MLAYTHLSPINAQENTCSEALSSATNLYNEGIIEDIPNLLNPCLEEGFTKNEKIEAYKLMILAYLFDDNQFEAEKTMLAFLKDFPEYELRPTDPIEFVYFFKTFETVPIVSFGFLLGGNLSNAVVTQTYTTGNFNDHNANDNMGIGYTLGANISRRINNRMSIHLDLLLAGYNYTFTDKIFEISEINMKESLTLFSTPVSVTYDITQNKNKAYVRLGGGINYLISSIITPSRTNIQGESGDVTGADIDMIDHRPSVNYFALAGGGYKIKIGSGELLIDGRFNIGLTDMVNDEARYKNRTLWHRYFFIEDDFLLANFGLTVGYKISLFKPVKKQ
jgi:hypothetical protein